MIAGDLSAITVNLPAGTYEDYQLIAVFSDDDPRAYSGTTVTQEPADLDVKYVFSFQYETVVIEKHLNIKSETSSSDFDISTLATDLGRSLSQINSSYQIAWYVNNGSANINFYTSDYTSDKWVMTSDGEHTVAGGYSPEWSNSGDGTDKVTLTGADLTSSSVWDVVKKMRVRVPKNTETFKDYPDYRIICEVKVPSSNANAAIRYIFYFDEEPDDFPGTFSGAETNLSHEVESRSTSTTTTIDMSGVLSTLPSAKYGDYIC